MFEDDGYSGAHLVRPGLEAIRDLAAQGQIEAVLLYSPDRLSRKYAYQVVQAEEFARCGASLIFLKSPRGETPEDQLLVQFQGIESYTVQGLSIYGIAQLLNERQVPTRLNKRWERSTV